jgi:hypothetical protein
MRGGQQWRQSGVAVGSGTALSLPASFPTPQDGPRPVLLELAIFA